MSKLQRGKLNLRGVRQAGNQLVPPAQIGGRMVTSSEVARAIPSSRGEEEPGRLQKYKTQLHTYFTVVGGTVEVFAADSWCRVQLQLESAGPVAAGTDADLQPVLSGKGILLDTDEPQPFYLQKGERLFIAANTVDRVKIIIDPIPWLDEIAGRILGVGRAITGAIATAIGVLSPSRAQRAAEAIEEATASQIPCPPKRRTIPRLKVR